MKHIIMLVLLVCSIFTPVHAAQGDLQLRVDQNYAYLIFRFTAVADQVIINDVIVNRGACNRWSLGNPRPGTVLKYGQSKDWKLMINNPTSGAVYPCEILEVAVVTPEGRFTFTRNQQ